MPRLGYALGLAVLILSAPARAQSTGPDVIVAAVHNIANYTAVGGTDAFSVGTTSCNIGTAPLLWQAATPNHPVIAQHLYRIGDGRCDMIGQSWLKHGFATVNSGICGSCSGPTGQQLYPFCSDPYDASLNGTQSGLGPKFEVDAHTGVFPYPYTGQFASGDDVYKRLQFALADVDPVAYPGSTYWVEAHYVSPDDAAAGNQDNNASVRELLVGGSPVDRILSLAAGSTTLQQTTALEVWPTLDPAVQLQIVDVPGEGRLQVAVRGTDLPNGSTRYVYAVHNLNSHRSVRQIDVAMPAGALVQNLDFHAPTWHSGEPYSNAAWPGAYSGSAVTWSTDTEAVDPNANAIRWGTTYTFSFDSDLPPTGTVTLGLFRAGSPAGVSTVFTAPPFTLALPVPAPATVSALATTPVDVQVTPVGDTHDPADAQLRYSVNGSVFVSEPLVYLGGDLYRANLPPIPFGFQLDWYVEIGAL
ncbi:MAG: hypothetical protein R3F20_07940, partial [Planctomycetota bacterium]